MHKISSIFLDRDGVINEKLEGDYVKKWEEFKFLHGAIEGIKMANDKKIPVYLITNQSGIGRGKMTYEDFVLVHKQMFEEMALKGAHLDDVFVCPHAPEENCSCRKPKPGMIFQAKGKYPEIDLKNSWFIGDSDIDVEAGRSAGCHTYKIKKNESLKDVISGIING